MENEELVEAIIEPDLPIVDPHHHLWTLSNSFLAEISQIESLLVAGIVPILRNKARYLLDELLKDLTSGHNIRATVAVESGMPVLYRPDGPEAMKSLGEVEVATGIATMAACEGFSRVNACAGIVGNVDLRLGAAVGEILDAHINTAGGRYRGVRHTSSYAPGIWDEGFPQLLLDKHFRAGFKQLYKFGLSFDASLLEPQIPDLIDLARAFPETQIVLDHVGTPIGVGSYAGKKEERFPIWRENIRILSTCANVSVKLGGLGTSLGAFESFMSTPPAASERIATEWKPYIETCIESFGAERCMFESNFPADSGTCNYAVLWNTFKRLAMGASPAEKHALFSGTASRIYRINI